MQFLNELKRNYYYRALCLISWFNFFYLLDISIITTINYKFQWFENINFAIYTYTNSYLWFLKFDWITCDEVNASINNN